MGTQTRSHTIDGSVNWYYTYDYPNDVLVNASTIDVSAILSSVQARWTPVYSYTNAEVQLALNFTNVLGKSLSYRLNDSNWGKGVTKTVPLTRVDNASVTPSNVLVNTSDYFNSSNPTTRRITITTPNAGTVYWSDKSPGTPGYYINGTLSSATLTLGDIVLDVPPTATVSAISYDKPFYYAGLTTASVTVSDVAAYYGGSVTDVTFRIGQQTDSKSGNGTFSILLDTAGTFTPTVTVTDSRGQTYTETFAPITVLTYSAPTVTFTAERTNSSGKPDDEGTYATCPSTFIFADAIATAIAPSVVLTDENGTQTTPTVTWYTTRASDGTLSGTVNWASLSAGDTVYGLIPGLNTNYSYQISIRPRDSQGTGTAITQTVSSAFYTVDFLAGGHGIAFGKPASNVGFECAMDATFEDTLTAQDMTAQEVSDFVDSLNVGGGGTAVDLVIEQGTSGIWTYRKWLSGIAECWGVAPQTTISTSAWAAWGQVFEASLTSAGIPYPTDLFIEIPATFVTAFSVSGGATLSAEITSSGGSAVTAPRLYATRATKPSNEIIVQAQYHAIGRWK